MFFFENDVKLKIKAHAGPIWAVALSPDANAAFSAGSDQIIRQWNLLTGEAISP